MTRAECPDPVVLAEGADDICVRPLEQGESDLVSRLFDGLGERSRRQRFHGPKVRLSERELAQISSVDHRNREALVAVEMSSDRPIALFELVREADDDRTAEVAFVVADDWQGRGLGSILADRLAARARCLSFERLRADVVSSNERALALVRRMGRVVSSRLSGSGYEVEVALDRESGEMQLFRSSGDRREDACEERRADDVAAWPTDRGPAAVLPGSGRPRPKRPSVSARRANGPTTSPRAGEPCGTAA